MSIKILLAEDHHIIRQGIRSLLEKEIGIEVIGEAVDGRETVSLARQLKPDVVVMDVSMPNLNGIEATRQICEEDQGIKVIALSVHSDDPFVSGMLTAGAMGYLLKDCLLEELVKAIEAVANGRLYLSARIAQNVVQEYKSMKTRETRSVFSTLTAREREVLQMIAEGKSMKEIGVALFVSEKTVATHRQHIMDKLGIHTVPDLVKTAIREGLTHID
jgi:two-component system, NarL family, response regulator NreC